MKSQLELLNKVKNGEVNWYIEKSTNNKGFNLITYKIKKILGFIPKRIITSNQHFTIIDLIMAINMDFKIGDDKLNYEAYKNYAYKGFRENMTNTPMDLMHACLGMAGELGEILEVIKKHVFHNKPLDITDLTIEFGDFQWYEAVTLTLLGITKSDTMKANVAKLDSRYKDGRRDLMFRNTELEYKKVEDTIKN